MTAVGMRLEINGLDAEGWTATLVDLEANVEWFEAAGSDPITALGRLVEIAGDAYAKHGERLTAANVLLERVLDHCDVLGDEVLATEIRVHLKASEPF